jgi:Ca-activated chloride channel homolog
MKKTIQHIIATGALSIITIMATAQTENTAIRAGNKLYRKGQFDKAEPEYQKALQANPNNPVARYNMGNVQFRNKQFEEAEKTFDQANAIAGNTDFKEKTYYNKGVSLTKQQKLLESIEAYKSAVRLNPADADARFNLQKALLELQKQNEANKKQPEPQKKPQPNKQPKPKQSNLDKKKIEQYLQSLQQKEQEVQRKIQQNRSRAVTKPEKDW